MSCPIYVNINSISWLKIFTRSILLIEIWYELLGVRFSLGISSSRGQLLFNAHRPIFGLNQWKFYISGYALTLILTVQIDWHSVDGLLIGAELDCSIVIIDWKHGITDCIILGIGAAGATLSESLWLLEHDEHLDQQVKIILHVVVPQHRIKISLPGSFLLHR